MNTISETTSPGQPFFAGFWLIAAIPITLLILVPVSEMLGLGDDIYSSPGIFVLSVVHLGTGYLLARSLSRRAGLSDNKVMNLLGGLAFALGVVGVLLAIPEFAQGPIDRWLAKFRGAGNLEFGALFAPWTGMVAGIAGLALGLGLKEIKLALKLLALGFLTGFGLYLAIMYTMELLGFKVGSGRPVMLPTTFMAMWSTALVASAIFGRELIQSKFNGVQSTAPAHLPEIEVQEKR
jgi:hypothetical protein